MLETDYEYLKRIEEYAQRRWHEPLLCTYLWDKYDLETKLLNRQRLICRCDTDYAYDDDYNLRIINIFNTTSPFLNQTLRIKSLAYNSDGELEEGHLVYYFRYEGDTLFQLIGESPYIQKILKKQDFEVVTKFYPSDVTEWAETIDINEEPNISTVTRVHVRDYTEADYFVSKYGDDKNNGTLEAPFRTLQHASNVVPIGGTICALTDLELPYSCVFFKDCNLIAKDPNTVLNSGRGQFLTILPDTRLYIQDLVFNKDGKLIYDYGDGHYIFNRGDGLITVETEEIKPYDTYDLDITGDLYWISGETINLKIIDNNNSLTGKTIYIFNSLNELITTSTGATNFKYTVPYGLEYDTLTIIVLEDSYSYSKTFKVYNISANWYVDTINGDDNNTGTSLHDAFQTLEQAINHVTTAKKYIFFMGEETINNLKVQLNTSIRGLKNKSLLKTDTGAYFSVESKLTLSDIFLDTTLINTNNFIRSGSSTLQVYCFDDTTGGVVYVDGIDGNDEDTGLSWTHALKTLECGLGKGVGRIYYSGENNIQAPLHVDETVEIVGAMNLNQITSTNHSYFNIGTGKVLKLSKITLKNSTKTQLITKNTYTNNGTAKVEVII